MGQLSRPGHRVIIFTRCETRVFTVFKKAQDKDIKIYIVVKIRPTVIEIPVLTNCIYVVSTANTV